MAEHLLPLAPYRVLVVMGPAGSGKTTLAKGLARAFRLTCLDADDFHTQAAKGKMQRGQPLTDEDREPWLRSLASRIAHIVSGEEPQAVVACSALRERYRAELGVDNRAVRLIYLSVPKTELARRLALRTGHFAGPALLESQLETLEVPESGLHLDGTLPVPRLVGRVEQWLQREGLEARAD